jgi:hypothetical protein
VLRYSLPPTLAADDQADTISVQAWRPYPAED